MRLVVTRHRCVDNLESKSNTFTHDPFRRSRYIAGAERYVLENLTEKVRLQDVAAFVGLSPSHFSRVFRKNTGICFRDWLTIQRIHVAKHKLRNTDEPILRVGLDSGFGSISAFERAFKKHCGVTPSAFVLQEICSVPFEPIA